MARRDIACRFDLEAELPQRVVTFYRDAYERRLHVVGENWPKLDKHEDGERGIVFI